MVRLNDDMSEDTNLLTTIFNTPELNDCYDEDILFVFKGLLNEKSGVNIRNKIAHGIMDSDECNCGTVKYFFAATIKLLSLYSEECHQIYERLIEELKRVPREQECADKDDAQNLEINN